MKPHKRRRSPKSWGAWSFPRNNLTFKQEPIKKPKYREYYLKQALHDHFKKFNPLKCLNRDTIYERLGNAIFFAMYDEEKKGGWVWHPCFFIQAALKSIADAEKSENKVKVNGRWHERDRRRNASG